MSATPNLPPAPEPRARAPRPSPPPALNPRPRPPRRYGLIFHSTFIGRAAAKNKGRISRYLANKCSIATRIDSFGDVPTNKFGEKLREQVEERLRFYDSGEAPKKNIDAMKEVLEELRAEAGGGDDAAAKAAKKAAKAAAKAAKAAGLDEAAVKAAKKAAKAEAKRKLGDGAEGSEKKKKKKDK